MTPERAPATDREPAAAGSSPDLEPIEPGDPEAWDPPAAPAARGRRWVRVTLGLAGAVLLVAGFLAGIEVEKHTGSPAAVAATASGGAAAGRTGAVAGGFAGAPGGGGLVAGTVKVIDGSTLYVTEPSGNTVAVTTTGARISITSTGALSAVRPGQTVVVRGTTAKNGSVAASSVQVGATSTFGGGGGGFFGGGGGGGAGG